jgi:hypothetical protein
VDEAVGAVYDWAANGDLGTPTCVVATGGGIHPYWLFREPWIFEDDAEHQEAATLLCRFQDGARAWWRERGWHLDSTHDLARVLRIPGTQNWKYRPQRPVSLCWEAWGTKYNQGDLEGVLGEVRSERSTGRLAVSLDLGPDMRAPERLFKAMEFGLVPKLEATWKREREDLAGADGQPDQNRYDLSLASMLAGMGFTDEEIVGAIAQHRREGGAKPEKALRQDYMAWTLAKAREGQEEDITRAQQRQEAASEEIKDKSVDWVDSRAEALQIISDQLGAPVREIRKVKGHPPSYVATIGDEDVDLGDSSGLITSRAFQRAVANGCGARITPLKEERWAPISAALLRLAEESPVDLGDESHPVDKVLGVLDDWIAKAAHVPEQDEEGWDGIVLDGLPARKGKRNIIFGLRPFYVHIRRGWRELTSAKLAQHLRAGGCEPKIVAVRRDGGRTTAKRWSYEQALPIGEKSEVKK